MTIPTTERSQLILNSNGLNFIGNNIELGSNLWNIFLRTDRLYVQNYGGVFYDLKLKYIEDFYVTNKYNNLLQKSTTSFWLWVRTLSGAIILYEIEPKETSEPLTLNTINIKEGMNTLSVYYPNVNYPGVLTIDNSNVTNFSKYTMSGNEQLSVTIDFDGSLVNGLSIFLPLTEKRLLLVYSTGNITYQIFKRMKLKIMSI